MDELSAQEMHAAPATLADETRQSAEALAAGLLNPTED